MAGTVTLETNDGLGTLRMRRAHGNAINGELLEDLAAACRQAQAAPEVRGVLLAAGGKLFCPGLDLQELIELDRPTLERFLERFSGCLRELYTFSKPMVAAIHGHAVAGGCVLSLCADWRVLAEGALIGLNEVKVGVPFPFGVAMMLRAATTTNRLEEVALFGRNYTDDEAVATGLVHEVHAREGFEAHCMERLEELADKDAGAFAITKRYLRSAAVERIAAHDARLAPDFLDAWFSESTQASVRRIVADLQARSG